MVERNGIQALPSTPLHIEQNNEKNTKLNRCSQHCANGDSRSEQTVSQRDSMCNWEININSRESPFEFYFSIFTWLIVRARSSCIRYQMWNEILRRRLLVCGIRFDGANESELVHVQHEHK